MVTVWVAPVCYITLEHRYFLKSISFQINHDRIASLLGISGKLASSSMVPKENNVAENLAWML